MEDLEVLGWRVRGVMCAVRGEAVQYGIVLGQVVVRGDGHVIPSMTL